MKTHNQIRIKAPAARVFAAASEILEWPRLLSHYRWVKVFKDQGRRRLVEMAAHRDGFPCLWRSEQILYPKSLKVYYRHLDSFWTSGMEVWWILKSRGQETEVVLTHDMPPTGNFLKDWFRQNVVGRGFVENIAGKTLAGLKRRLEEAK